MAEAASLAAALPLEEAPPVQLAAGQRVLMYVSAPYWSTPTAGAYTLTINKQ